MCPVVVVILALRVGVSLLLLRGLCAFAAFPATAFVVHSQLVVEGVAVLRRCVHAGQPSRGAADVGVPATTVVVVDHAF